MLVDCLQGSVHRPIDVRELDVDFYAFSSHKLYGPTGFGVLYAKREHLEAMQPWQGGGDMIRTVAFDGRDRKSVVSGKSVSVRVDIGGSRIITKKETTTNIN